MKNKWALLDLLTLVLLAIMVWAVAGEIIEVSKVDLSPKETVELAFTGLYTGREIDVDESFEGDRLSLGKEWISARIVALEKTNQGVVFKISGSAEGRSGKILMGKQALKIGKEFVLETDKLKIPITILEIEKTGEQ